MAFAVGPSDLLPRDAGESSRDRGSTTITPRKASAKRAAESTFNPYLHSAGYRYCQGNCSTIPRPLSEFGAGESKKCLWCLSRQAGKSDPVLQAALQAQQAKSRAAVAAAAGGSAGSAPSSPHPVGDASDHEDMSRHLHAAGTATGATPASGAGVGIAEVGPASARKPKAPGASGVRAGGGGGSSRAPSSTSRPPLFGSGSSGSVGSAAGGAGALVVDTGSGSVGSSADLPAPEVLTSSSGRVLKKAASFTVKRKRASDSGSQGPTGTTSGARGGSGSSGSSGDGVRVSVTVATSLCSVLSPTNPNDSFSRDIRNALAPDQWVSYPGGADPSAGEGAGGGGVGAGRRDSVIAPPLKRGMSMGNVLLHHPSGSSATAVPTASGRVSGSEAESTPTVVVPALPTVHDFSFDVSFHEPSPLSMSTKPACDPSGSVVASVGCSSNGSTGLTPALSSFRMDGGGAPMILSQANMVRMLSSAAGQPRLARVPEGSPPVFTPKARHNLAPIPLPTPPQGAGDIHDISATECSLLGLSSTLSPGLCTNLAGGLTGDDSFAHGSPFRPDNMGFHGFGEDFPFIGDDVEEL